MEKEVKQAELKEEALEEVSGGVVFYGKDDDVIPEKGDPSELGKTLFLAQRDFGTGH